MPLASDATSTKGRSRDSRGRFTPTPSQPGLAQAAQLPRVATLVGASTRVATPKEEARPATRSKDGTPGPSSRRGMSPRPPLPRRATTVGAGVPPSSHATAVIADENRVAQLESLLAQTQQQLEAAKARTADHTAQSIVHDVQTLRTDVNAILERRSATSPATVPAKEDQVAVEAPEPDPAPEPVKAEEPIEGFGAGPAMAPPRGRDGFDADLLTAVGQTLTAISTRLERLEARDLDEAMASQPQPAVPAKERRHKRDKRRRRRRRSRSRRGRRNRRHRDDDPSDSSSSSSSSSSEEDVGRPRGRPNRRNYSSESDSDSDSDDETAIAVPFDRRRKGPKHPGLHVLRPSNPAFDRLMSYRYYRLRKTTHSRTARETGKVRDFIKRMDTSLRRHRFSGGDPVLILEFLRRFVQEADILGMSALLTTTMPYMKVVIDTLVEKGLRDDYIVLVGGAPLNEEFGEAVGADAYCRDAAEAATTAVRMVQQHRLAQSA